MDGTSDQLSNLPYTSLNSWFLYVCLPHEANWSLRLYYRCLGHSASMCPSYYWNEKNNVRWSLARFITFISNLLERFFLLWLSMGSKHLAEAIAKLHKIRSLVCIELVNDVLMGSASSSILLAYNPWSNHLNSFSLQHHEVEQRVSILSRFSHMDWPNPQCNDSNRLCRCTLFSNSERHPWMD